MAVLDLEKLVKDYGQVRAIHGVDLRIENGEFCVFVGPSGCGKSTLLRMIAGLEDITGGELRIDGARVNEQRASERGLAMVFQTYALYPHMTVRQNLAFGLENIRTPKPEIESRVAEAARMLQIEAYLDRRPKQLSGGQRQRVAIGRAVVREPRVFLFDEPLSNLDAELRVTMRGEISALHRRLGNTMIYVTHDQVEAMTMADKIVVLQAGIIEQVGAPLELYNNPKNRFVAGFIGSPKMNFLEATVQGSDAAGAMLRAGGSDIVVQRKIATGDKVTFGVRPEHIGLSETAGVKLAEVKVDLVEQLGGQTMVYATTDDSQPLIIAVDCQRQVELGSRLTTYVDPARYHVFGADGRAI